MGGSSLTGPRDRPGTRVPHRAPVRGGGPVPLVPASTRGMPPPAKKRAMPVRPGWGLRCLLGAHPEDAVGEVV